MAETLFSLNKMNFKDCQHLFRGERNQEYYCGDYWLEDSPVIDVRAERKTVGATSIILQRSATRQFFRRTRQHIRDDATDLSVLWFVRRGRIVYSDQCGNRIAEPGDFIITRSMSPFLIECQPDEDSVHEFLNVTVPTHILRGHIGSEISSVLFLSCERRELSIAESILSSVFEDDGHLTDGAARTLVDAALATIGHAVRADETAVPARQTVADRRLQDVLRFIEVHLSDSNLSTSMVARGCGISPRYLSFLLRLNGTSFSELVWEQRLEKAKSWLSTSNPRDISISEIAYGVGFKSPAHFSRMFKRVFKMNPREFRGGSADDLVPQDYEIYGDMGGLLLQ
jgi:AraC-like DNA-binding protein